MITEDDFITVYTPDWILEAANHKHETTKDYDERFGENDSRPAAFAAEMVVSHTLEVPIVGEYLTTHDFEYQGLNLDLKTIRRSVKPKLFYESNVLAKNTKHQNTLDYYFFADTLKDGTRITFTGYISKADFRRYSILHKKGELMNGKAGTYWYEDTYSIEIRHLKPYTWFGDRLKELFEHD